MINVRLPLGLESWQLVCEKAEIDNWGLASEGIEAWGLVSEGIEVWGSHQGTHELIHLLIQGMSDAARRKIN